MCKLNLDVIHELELLKDPEIFGQPPRDFLKRVMTDILAYQDCIVQMYNLSIAESNKRLELNALRNSQRDTIITDLNTLRRGCQSLGIQDPFDDADLTQRRNCTVMAFELLYEMLQEN